MTGTNWIVGEEYNEKHFSLLTQSLKALGYKIENISFGVGGSQEIQAWRAVNNFGVLTIESETYIGSSVTGPSELVKQLKLHFTSRAF